MTKQVYQKLFQENKLLKQYKVETDSEEEEEQEKEYKRKLARKIKEKTKKETKTKPKKKRSKRFLNFLTKTKKCNGKSATM